MNAAADLEHGMSARAVGFRLKIIRHVLGLTQDEMGRMCGLKARSAWSNYEKGYRTISRRAAVRLCLATGVSTDFIYRGRLNDVARDLARKIQVELRRPRNNSEVS